MSEPTNNSDQTNNSGSTTTPSGADDAEVKNNGDSKSFTQEQVNAMIQKRVSEVSAKAEEKRKADIEAALAEHDRQAKLTEEQRADEARKKRDDEVAKREREVTLRENRAEAIEVLAEKKLDTKLVDLVVNIDKDKMSKNIENLESAFNEAVKNEVESRMAGNTPTDFGDGSKTTGGSGKVKYSNHTIKHEGTVGF